MSLVSFCSPSFCIYTSIFYAEVQTNCKKRRGSAGVSHDEDRPEREAERRRRRRTKKTGDLLSHLSPLLPSSSLFFLSSPQNKPNSERDRAHDKGCEYRIRKDSGYCECTGGLTTKRFVSCFFSLSFFLFLVSLSRFFLPFFLLTPFSFLLPPHNPFTRVSCGRHGGFTCDDECEKLNGQPELARRFPSNVSCPSSSSSLSGGGGGGGRSASSSSSSAAAAAVGPNTSPARAALAVEASAAARETAIAGGWWHLRVSGSGSGTSRARGEKGGGEEENADEGESEIVVAADTSAGREADAAAAALWSSLSAAFAAAKEAAAVEAGRLAGGGGGGGLRRRRRRKNRGGGRRGGARSDAGGGGGDESGGGGDETEPELQLREEEDNVLLIPERRTDGRDWSIDGARLPARVVKAALAGQRAFLDSLPATPGGGGGAAAAEKDETPSSSSSPAAASAATPPPPLFSGRGVVFLGGGPTYLVPTLVALRALRLSGCSLPVEVWFPRAEAPTRGLERLLGELGAVARLLPGEARTVEGAVGAKAGGAAAAAAAAAEGGKKRKHSSSSSSSSASTFAKEGEEQDSADDDDDPSAAAVLGPSLGPAGGDGDLSGFTMKAAALLLSRFREVLFLDSDNVAALDPEALFESAEFKEKGAILWPDYWESTAARDAAAALGLDEEEGRGEREKKGNGRGNGKGGGGGDEAARSPPSSSSSSSSSSSPSSSSSSSRLRGSHESGQMLFDKARAWPALALAAYFNSAPGFYYEVLGCFMGKGDKETFAAALAATRTAYHRIATPVGSVGLAGPARRCWGRQRWCSGGFAGNTMTQHDT